MAPGPSDTSLFPHNLAVTSLLGAVERYVHLNLHTNAIFLAERLVAEQPSEAHQLLLATCHIRAGAFKPAYSILQGCTAPANRYMLAYCCLQLDKLLEAETALLVETDAQEKGPERCREILLSTGSSYALPLICPLMQPEKIPEGAAGFCLLGKICHRANRREHAIEYYKMSLELDPLLWTSFEALCQLDAQADPSDYFGPPLPLQASLQGEEGAVGSTVGSPFSTPRHPHHHAFGLPTSSFRTPFDAAPQPMDTDMSMADSDSTPFRVPEGRPLFQTPNLTPIPSLGSESLGLEQSSRHPSYLRTPMMSPPQDMGTRGFPDHPITTRQGMVTRGSTMGGNIAPSPSPMVTATTSHVTTRSGASALKGATKLSFASTTGDTDKQPSRMTRGHVHSRTPSGGGKMRRRASSSSVTGKGVEEGEMDNSGGSPAMQQQQLQHVPLQSFPPPPAPQQPQFDANGINAMPSGPTAIELLPLLSTLGSGYQLLCRFRCPEALDMFNRINSQQFYTGWVQHCVGRAYFEMADYPRAKRALETMQQVQPYRTSGLELLSTALWHLKKEVDLCFLAQRVTELDRRCPECWCVVGNCFSLQKEHETALKFFQRAIQVNPHFTYAYTLCGHEYVCNEDFEKAVACYRYAIRIDERHYNAWYGLGTIYFRQEKYDMAEYHFSKALSINSQSSVLHCYLGMVLHSNHKFQEALDMLAIASKMEPRNPQARFQRATVLMKMEKYKEALEELEKVRDYVPREASVYHLMGKICKRLGQKQRAMRYYITALDLDPKDSNLVKAAIDRIDQSELEEDDKL